VAKIIIIEDNPANMKLAAFLLHSAGHEVIQAADAETGLALIRKHLPALVLMDMQLPGMDGLAATRRLKADAELKHIKIVALTAHAMKGDEENFRTAGCDGYLPKPFSHRDLLALVNKLLE
jgi:two-component system cell cycle response regulator DivK